MDAQTDILKRGLAHAGQAVLAASALGNLHLGPKRLGRRMARRISGRLRQIETLVRRIVFLMALRLPLAPPVPRAAPAGPAPQADLPEGVELAVFPRLPPRRLKLLPARQPFVAGSAFPAESGRATGPVLPFRLMARITALQRVIADPEAHARRLARHLRRLRQRGEPRPVVGPAGPAFRLSPELGALAALLPEQINAALDTWETSG